MNFKKSLLAFGAIAVVGVSTWLIAADHVDAPDVRVADFEGTTSDIADLYAFQSEQNNSKMVLVGTMQGLMSPQATQNASFDEDVLLEFNIDNDGDLVEDLVIQCTFKDNQMIVYGPLTPDQIGLTSVVTEDDPTVTVDVTPYGTSAISITENDVKAFAGARDDPFFFDILQYNEIVAKRATSFRTPGVDTFAGTNVMAVVLELPKSMFGVGSGASFNVWLESKRSN